MASSRCRAPSDTQHILWRVRNVKAASTPSDLCSASAAARAVGITAQGLSYWIESGRIATYGRGPRRAVLVSLAEVQAVAEQKRQTVSQTEARRILGMDIHTVRLLCESGELPSYQAVDRGDIEVDREAVLRLAAERKERRHEHQTRFVNVEAAARLVGWPRWVLDKFIDEGRIPVRPGERGANLIERDFLTRFVEELTANPDLCPTCGESLPPGRKVHKGACAATQAGLLRRDPAFVAQVNGRLERNLKALKRAQGLRDVCEVARLLDREPRVIWRYIWKLGLGAKYTAPGGQRVLLTSDEVKQIRERVDEAFQRIHGGDVKSRADWHRARFGSMKLYGRYSKELAEKKGKSVGRWAELLTDDKLKFIEQLHSRGCSQRDIARRLGISRGLVQHALTKIKASAAAVLPE
jgi:transposase-like protein